MSSKSDYLEKQVLDHFLGTTESTFVTQKYLALHTADPTETGTGAEVANSNNYSRQAINFNPAHATNGTATNNADITFTANSNGGFGTVTHFGIWDNSGHGAGNMLYYGALPGSGKTIDANDSLKFSANTGITITEG